MAYYNFKMVRDRLPEWRVKEWEESGGSADYDSELWRHAAEYIDELKLQIDVSECCQELERQITLGAYLGWQDRKWWLFRKDGEGIESGKTIEELLFKLDYNKL